MTIPTTYRYLLADLVTNQILAELPLTRVSFSSVLNAAGSFNASLLVTDSRQTYLNIWPSTQPGRTAIYVERQSDGGTPVLVWGGIIWSREYDSTTQHISLSALEFESYFDHRRVLSPNTSKAQVFTSTDQLTIARTLVNNAQIGAGANIGVLTGTETSGQLISKTYYDSELRTVLSALQDLAKSATGFDFKVDVSYDGAFNPVKTLQLGYPRLGASYSSSNPTAPVLEFPGNVVQYVYTEDGLSAANVIFAAGAGSGEGQLNLKASDSAQITTYGWPLLEDSRNYGDVVSQSLLSSLALGQLNAVKNPPVSIKIIYPPYLDPLLGTYNLGDDIRIRLNDDRAGQVDDYYRIVGISVQPGENGPERATLTLTQKGAV